MVLVVGGRLFISGLQDRVRRFARKPRQALHNFMGALQEGSAILGTGAQPIVDVLEPLARAPKGRSGMYGCI